MFDELDKNSPQAPAAPGPSAKTEDIFADVDKGAKPDVFKPKADNPAAPYATVISADESWLKHKNLIFGSILGVLILIVAGFVILRFMVKNSATPAASPVITENQSSALPEKTENQVKTESLTVAPEATATPETVTAPAANSVFPSTLDSDHDGLTDDEETKLGISPSNPDTDLDGLTDRQEVKVYRTNPLNPDTDGDGYKDGDEVRNGYNPLGPGKLLNAGAN